MRDVLLFAVLVSAISIQFSSAAFADVINVPVDQPTIQDAINAANPGDEVVVAPGTYSEIINLLGKAITVRSSGGPAVTTIDASAVADPGTGKPVIRCDSSENLDTVIQGFTVAGGTGDTTFGPASGGGMFIDDAQPTVIDCVFTGNTAATGGGVYIASDSEPMVANCLFSGNMASVSGGGVYNRESAPTIANCIFDGNTATTSGGGMLNHDNAPMVTNCLFKGNTASSGAGMTNVANSQPLVTNCTFFGNTATGDGGGMFNDQADPTITNCIFWGNSDAGGMDESGQIHIAAGTDAPLVNYSDVQGGWTGAVGTGNIQADPLFLNAPGGDLRLMADSPCIDAGDTTAVSEPLDLAGNDRVFRCLVDMGVYEDQAGSPFFVHNLTQDTHFYAIQEAIDAAVNGDVIEAIPCTYNEIIDFSGKAITLRSTDPTDPTVVAKTIIDATNVPDPGTGKPVVRCDSGEGPDTVLSGLTITGGTGDTSLSATSTSGGGMFNNGSSPTVSNCTFSGNSVTVDGDFMAGRGGGMYNKNSSTTVTDCVFIGNTAAHDAKLGSGSGGAIYNDSSNPTVTGCTVSGNHATSHGGGIVNKGGTPVVTNCTLSGNTAADGGAMYNDYSDSMVMGCTFTANSASADGAGMNSRGGNPVVTDCTFTENIASDQGGGMYSYGGSPTVTDCMFIQNSALAGAGMYNLQAVAVVTGCTFAKNSATGFGGGLLHSNGGGITMATNCTFVGNTAYQGGGVSNASTVALTNCVVSGNVADMFGGGLVNRSGGTTTTMHCTFSGNTAFTGGGIYTEGLEVVVTNSIFWANADTDGMDESAQIDGTGVVNYSDVQGGWTGAGGTGNINVDPVLVDPDGADDIAGTNDDDLRILPGSPAIDAADSLAAAVAGIQLDFDGNSRAADDPATPNTGVPVLGLDVIVDMGAYEFQSVELDADLDNDGDVDLDDFALFMQQFVGPF